MPNIDLSILNQRQTPAFYADVFANRPAAGFVGRIFVSTDTYAFYRDNGTGWDLIGGPGTGTVTGTGANGQVTFWNGASTITGSNDLFWDTTNGHFGVNTNAPGTALDVHHDQPTVAILNQTVATNDVRIGFQNNGVGLWRIGAFYNAGANDFGIYDAVAAIQPVTVKKTTGQVLIGTSTVGSGKLVVASASSDNGIQIVGASAPSLRIDSAESGPTKRAGLGISTATNNFIQGSADRDFCIFNGSTAAASPILFGVYDAGAVNVQEAARISAARNFLIGTTTDAGFKFQVAGSARIATTPGTSGEMLTIRNTQSNGSNTSFGGVFFSSSPTIDFCIGKEDVNTVGTLKIKTQSGTDLFALTTSGAATFSNSIGINAAGGTNAAKLFVAGTTSLYDSAATRGITFFMNRSGVNVITSDYIGTSYLPISLSARDNNGDLYLTTAGNTLIGTTTDAGQKLQVNGIVKVLIGSDAIDIGVPSGNSYRSNLIIRGSDSIGGLSVSYYGVNVFSTDGSVDMFSTNGICFRAGGSTTRMTIKSTGIINMSNVPTSSAGLVSGDIYQTAGVLNIVP